MRLLTIVAFIAVFSACSGEISSLNGSGGSSADSGGSSEHSNVGSVGGAINVAGAAAIGGVNSGGNVGIAGTSGQLAPSCAYQCTIDADCVVGSDAAAHCDSVTHRCVRPGEVCDTDDDCVPFASHWVFSCMTDSDCAAFLGEVCVLGAGVGWCAEMIDPPIACFRPTNHTLLRARFGVAGEFEVCGNSDGRCENHRCALGCSAASSCSDLGLGPNCNLQMGRCACQSNAECSAPGADECVAGRCGCSGTAACPASPFAHATPVCE